jgi:GNAT superfamily N-acetyltransferase
MGFPSGLKDRFRNALLKSALAGNSAVARLCPTSGATCARLAGGYAFFNGAKDLATRALQVGFEAAITEDQLDALAAFYHQRGAKVAFYISDDSDARYPIELIKRRGYEKVATLVTWWRSLEVPLPELDAQEVAVCSPRPGPQTELWARTVATGFRETNAAVPSDGLEEWELCHFCARASVESSHAFLALRSGEAAGGAILQVTDGIASLRSASVRFAHRGHGVQRALIGARLKQAIAAGCDVAFAVAEKNGASEKNLRRFGFSFLCEGAMIRER